MFPTRLWKLLFIFSLATCFTASGQKDLPKDYLTKEFHKGRREAIRAIMPSNSVLAIFSAPSRTFSNDAEYLYHQNPDMYYFTGYMEPNGVLLVFKEPQKAADGHSFSEVLFVQKRDALREQWTGRRLGTTGVKEKLGIQDVFEGTEFRNFPVLLSGFDKILFSLPTGLKESADDSGDLTNLVKTFREKAGIPATYNEALDDDLLRFEQRGKVSFATVHENIKRKNDQEAYRTNPLIAEIVSLKDTTGAGAVQQKIKEYISKQRFSAGMFKQLTGRLREIKTAEEMVLLRKAIDISCVGHVEAIKAIKPSMSELEIQGIQEFVHKKYGAEEVGYSSIVGSGDNGCILHYIENSRTEVGKDMIVMDIGAEY
ncbi:MAG TPA: aminopeptidase P N-terminal domain-containing protein, partial [Chitinophagaceae bacterium]|nr:aminopeptidase P N-terminal domain-containing protein [Chitinophagaceae bacterium]